MEKKRTLDKNQSLYQDSFWWTFWAYYIKLLHNIFYKEVLVEGIENIPKNTPIIFTPNHQNAVMDPTILSFASKTQVVYMARADIFSNKFSNAMLHFLRVLPVYRIRDGKENLKNNDSTFNISIKVLEHKRSMGIFPEATHNDKRRLLPLKKGVPRLAFLAEKANNFELGVQIVPTGIYYSRYSKMRSVIHIQFGKPIKVSDYKKEYEEAPQKAHVSLNNDIRDAMYPLMIDIRNLELYDTYESIRKTYVKSLIQKFKIGIINQTNKFKADKTTIHALNFFHAQNPEKMQELKNKVGKFENLKIKYKLSYEALEKQTIKTPTAFLKSIIALIGLPVYIYSAINNIFTYFVPKLLIKKIEDTQFHSSLKFLWTVFFMPVFVTMQIIIIAIVFPNIWIILAYTLSLPILSFFARIYSEWVGNIITEWRLIKLQSSKSADYDSIIKLRSEIISDLDIIVTDWYDNQKK